MGKPRPAEAILTHARFPPSSPAMFSHGLLAKACRVSKRVQKQVRLISSHAANETPVSIAPKASIDVKSIRQNPDLYARNCVIRNYQQQAEYPHRITVLFQQWLELQKQARNLRHDIKTLRARLSGVETTQSSEDRTSTIEQARRLKSAANTVEEEEEALELQIQSLAVQLPNLTSQETPLGAEPETLEYLNRQHSVTNLDLKRDHVQIGAAYDLLDFSGAGPTSGWGWYYLKNEAALLEQALISYAIKVVSDHGFSVVSPPSMTYSHIATACGFRPRDRGDEQQIYTIQQDEADSRPTRCMTATAEIPFAGMNANKVLEEKNLPMHIAGPSRCYRAEAGSRGVQTKGLYRVHEFTKVEMFAWTTPEGSPIAFEKMLQVQKEILGALGLYCRVLEMPASDLGASAMRKQDIEACFPSRLQAGIDQGWGEVTSTSICSDYQSRRLNTRMKGSSGLKFVHTVNGTALAVPRVLAAVLEYGQTENSIRIPEVLWPWMHGITEIKKNR